MLIHQRQVAGPSGCRETRSAPSSLAGAVVANVIVRVRFCGNVRAVAIGRRSFVGRGDNSLQLLVAGDRKPIAISRTLPQKRTWTITSATAAPAREDLGRNEFRGAPMGWLMALVNQQAVADGRKRTVGFINPAISRSGWGRAMATTSARPRWYGKYSSETGYDLVTGWGSPKGPAGSTPLHHNGSVEKVHSRASLTVTRQKNKLLRRW